MEQRAVGWLFCQCHLELQLFKPLGQRRLGVFVDLFPRLRFAETRMRSIWKLKQDDKVELLDRSSFHTITHLLHDSENSEGARLNLQCKLITINWPALSQSRWSNFLSYIINQVIFGMELLKPKRYNLTHPLWEAVGQNGIPHRIQLFEENRKSLLKRWLSKELKVIVLPLTAKTRLYNTSFTSSIKPEFYKIADLRSTN